MTNLACTNPLSTQIRALAAPKLECPEAEIEVMPDDDKPPGSAWIAGCDFQMVYVDGGANQRCKLRPPERAAPWAWTRGVQ
jgi:hypothetical protein